MLIAWAALAGVECRVGRARVPILGIAVGVGLIVLLAVATLDYRRLVDLLLGSQEAGRAKVGPFR